MRTSELRPQLSKESAGRGKVLVVDAASSDAAELDRAGVAPARPSRRSSHGAAESVALTRVLVITDDIKWTNNFLEEISIRWSKRDEHKLMS
jgi:hypothetical protein